MAGVRRDAVQPGQVFELLKREGGHGTKKYLAIGNNGKFFSLNTANGELASTDDGAKRVALVGKGKFSVTYLPPAQQTTTTRRNVRNNQVFKAAGKDRENSYAAVGRLSDGRWASLNLHDPFDSDYAVTENGDRKVVIIGTYEAIVTHV
jgi:hypothetical protein